MIPATRLASSHRCIAFEHLSEALNFMSFLKKILFLL